MLCSSVEDCNEQETTIKLTEDEIDPKKFIVYEEFKRSELDISVLDFKLTKK